MSKDSCREWALADPCYIKEAQACPEHPLPIAKLDCQSRGEKFRKGTGSQLIRELVKIAHVY